MMLLLRLSAVALAISGSIPAAPGRAVSDDEVRQVHQSALLIDTHNDVTSLTVKGADIAAGSPTGHTSLARLRSGGLGAVFFAVYVAASYAKNGQAAHRALEMIDTVRHDIAGRHPADFSLAFTADDILAARRQGRIAALMGIEGGHAIEDSLRLLRQFYALGVRYMTLTHSNNNNWADSSGEAPRHNGLTPFGKDVIREMNRLGMMVDVSHVSDKTFWDALETSRAPLFASHSSCRALSRIPRNMTDDMIAALARKGGVVQINFGCEFLSQKSADASSWTNKSLPRPVTPKEKEEERARIPQASLSDVVAHIDHVVKLAGAGAVGIGSDFDGVECVPSGLEDVSKFPALTRALLEKGYSAGDIRKIYGGNLLRVMRAVENARQP
jgi:membrane dipeptidase